jgi:hypothetical protein
MSLFDTLKNVAGEVLGNMTQHPARTNPDAVADHLAQHAQSLDEITLRSLGRAVLQTFTAHSAYPDDGAQAAQEAGTTAEAVASGEPNAVSALLAFAKNHPEVLESIAHSYPAEKG